VDAGWRFDNRFVRELEGCYAAAQPARVSSPKLVFLNQTLAQELGLKPEALAGQAGADLFTGQRLPEGAQPVAQAYAGHQFGGFSPQLGDGRALLLGEVIDREGRRRDIAFKGSGRTPFSRGGDGLAALGPMLREVLIGEALHALGVPTTRALAVAATGDGVRRERMLPGAVLTRVAASHLRVGTCQFFAARGETERLRRLVDHAISRHDPQLSGDDPARFLAFFEALARRQAVLIAQWMNLGFIHGVMNTDNMTLSGESIDFGPCAWMEGYDPQAVFSSIDLHGRYAFDQQPLIAQWNLARLAEALLPLIDEDAERAVAQAMTVLDAFPSVYERAWREGQARKFGWSAGASASTRVSADREVGASRQALAELADDWLSLLATKAVDFTLAWRHLADAALGDERPLLALGVPTDDLTAWLKRWRQASQAHLGHQAGALQAERIRAANPRVVPRNHRVEEALAAASQAGDFQPFERLLSAVRDPFGESPAVADLAQPAPRNFTSGYQTFCGT
jgi:serine/tyrosine/threonine adenylyltransferase